MANSRFTQFMYTKHGMPVVLDVKVPIGGTGAVGTLVGGAGIASVVRNAVGTYQINLSDSYNKYLGMSCSVLSPNSGSSILVASAGTVSGTQYIITIVGTTTTAGWQSLGLPVGITPAVGVSFKATATTTATGTGAVQIPASSGIITIAALGDPTKSIFVTGIGASNPYITVQCLGATATADTAMVPADPASGSSLMLSFYLSNSSNNAKDNG